MPTLRLRTLRLANYRRFRDAAIEFPDGLIGLVGRNGMGKSTLLESVLWCLFGHDAARTSKDLLKRQGAAPGEDVVVRLEFEIDGCGYALTRRLRGRSLQPEAALESGGHLLVAPGPNSWEQANLAVVGLLGFERADFESTVVAKQGELAALSELRPGDRKRLLLGLLGVEKVESAIRTARLEARETEARLQGARRELEREGRLRQELDAAKGEASRSQQEVTRAESEAATLEPKLHRARDAAARLLQDRHLDQELRVRLQALQSRLEGIWQARTRMSAETQLLREREEQAVRAEQELLGLQDLDARIVASEEGRLRSRQRESLLDRLRALEAELGRWEPLLDPHAHNGSSPASLQSELEDRRVALRTATREISGIDGELQLVDHELRRLEAPAKGHGNGFHSLGPDDTCPTCERPLGESLHVLRRRLEADAVDRERSKAELTARAAALRTTHEKARAVLARAEVEVTTTEQRLVSVRERLRDAELARKETRRLQDERSTLLAELQRLEEATWDANAHAALVAARGRRDALRETVARLREAASRIPRLQEEDRVLRAQEQEVVRERESAARELQRLGYEAGAWEAAHKEAEQAAHKMEALGRHRTQWQERLAAHRREADRTRTELALLAERRSEADAWAARLRILEALCAGRGDAGLLPEFKTHLIGRVRPALARAASDLLSRMTQGRYSEMALDEDYGGRLYDGGHAHPLERFSGGEVDVANLALRLAVSELVANARGRSRLQFVALDEVFGSQDDERRRGVLQSLQGLSQVFRQVFVVTHLEDVRERLEHVLRVVDAGDGTSRLDPSWAKA